MVYTDLILNLSFLVALSVVSGFIEEHWPRDTRVGVLMQGAIFGGAAVLGMLRPLILGPGLIFDGRSVMVSLCALYYGPWAAATATLMTVACRLGIGGVGTVMGVLVIVSSAGIGLLARFRLKPEGEPPSTWSLYLLGLAVHLAMVALMFTLPASIALTAAKRVGLPVLLLYPLATILAGKILSDRVSTIRYLAHLKQSRQDLDITLQSIGDAVISTDMEARIVLMNPVAEGLTGWNKEEARGRPLEEVFRIVNEQTQASVENPTARVLSEGVIVGLANHTLLIARDGTERSIADSGAPIRAEDGTLTGVVLVFRDQTSERAAQRLVQTRLTLIQYAAAHTRDEFLSKALDEIGAFVNSPIGFFHFLDSDQKTLSLQQWSTRTLEEFCRAEGEKQHFSIDQAGVWVDCVREKKPVIHNDYSSLEHKKGTPEGHPGVVRVLVVPVMRENRVVAILGVGNKPVDYTEKDAETVAYLADVTWEIVEHKRAVEVQRESAEINSAIVNQATEGIVLIDSETLRFVEFNDAACNGLGYSREEFARLALFDIQGRLTPEECTKTVRGIMQTGHARFENRQLRKDGSLRDVLTSAVSLLDRKIIIALWLDITERKLAEEALKRSEEKYRELVENANSIILRMDGVGNVTFINEFAQRFFGYREDEILGKNVVGTIVPPIEATGRDLRLIEDIAQNPDRYASNISENMRRSGERVWIAWTNKPVRYENGQVVEILCVGNDITERKRAEEEKERLEAQLRQAQRLEAVGTLAGGIAHDFNNILAPIIGYTELALNSLPQGSSMRSGQEQVLGAALRAKDLVKQILAFGRSGGGHQQGPVEISSVVKEALKLLRASLPSSIEISHRIERGVANADPTQIHQILMNLCTNAAHAMGDKGILKVELSSVDMSETDLAAQSIVDLEPGPYLKLSVSDTGIGMDQATLERIFDPFFTTKEVGKGSGLGLSVVNGIVKQHHGAITVRSAPGRGSEFSIYIPASEVNVIKVVEIEKPMLKGTERILLIDDEQILLEMGAALLQRLGYCITAEAESQRAYEVFKACPAEFDLVITDFTMPKMTGLDLAMAIRMIRHDIPIIICTGFSETMTEARSKELGLELLFKPYSINQLSETVRKVLDLEKSH